MGGDAVSGGTGYARLHRIGKLGDKRVDRNALPTSLWISSKEWAVSSCSKRPLMEPLEDNLLNALFARPPADPPDDIDTPVLPAPIPPRGSSADAAFTAGPSGAGPGPMVCSTEPFWANVQEQTANQARSWQVSWREARGFTIPEGPEELHYYPPKRRGYNHQPRSGH